MTATAWQPRLHYPALDAKKVCNLLATGFLVVIALWAPTTTQKWL